VSLGLVSRKLVSRSRFFHARGSQRRHRHLAQRRVRGMLACLRPRGVFEAPKYLSKFWVDQQRIHRPFLGGEGRPASVHRLGSAISSLSTRFRASHPCGKGKSAARMGHPSWYLIERSETWFQRVACRSNCAQGALLPAQIALRLGWKIQQRDSLPRGKSNFSGWRPLVRRRRPVFRGAEAEAAL